MVVDCKTPEGISLSAEGGGYPAVLREAVGVLVTASLLQAHRRFETGENLVVGNHGAAGVAHYDRRRVARDVVDGVEHGSDGLHGYVLAVGRNLELGAEVVGTVAEHGAPDNLEAFVGVVGYKLLAVEAFHATYGEGVAREGLRGHVAQGHRRGTDLVVVLQLDFEKVIAWQEVHGIAAPEGELVLSLHEADREQVVPEGVRAICLIERSTARLLFLREDDSLRMDLGGRPAQGQGEQSQEQALANGFVHKVKRLVSIKIKSISLLRGAAGGRAPAGKALCKPILCRKQCLS